MSRFHRQSNGPGGGGGSVSDAGSQGAATLFGGGATAVEGGAFPFGHSGMKAETKTMVNLAADAYGVPDASMAAASEPVSISSESTNGFSETGQAGQLNNQMNELPEIDLGAEAGGKLETPADFGQAIQDLLSNMGDALNQMVNSPMGFFGALFNFLLQVFSEIAESIVEFLSQFAKAAAAAIEDALKKQFEMASKAEPLLQPLELYNQAAITKTVSVSLKSSPST